MLTAEEDIQSSLHILLSTKLGERIMQPNFGCQMDEFQFVPLSRTTSTYISDLIEKAILYHEPRINVDKITLKNSDSNQGVVLISLSYTVRATNSRFNLVFPYYLEEGRLG